MTVDNHPIIVKKSLNSDEGQARITCPPTLAKNLDKLKVSFWIEWDDFQFLDELENIKQSIQATDNLQEKPYHCPGGFDWNVHRTGVKRYNYRLTSGDIILLLNTRHHQDNSPNMAFEIGSESCWIPGYKDIFERFIRWIEILGGKITKEKISEVHLAVDLIDIPIESLDIHEKYFWITRARNFTRNDTFRELSGISIGKDKMMLRIYDKIQELKVKQSVTKQLLFAEIWNLHPFNASPVTRVEFQIRRDVLKNLKTSIDDENGIDTFTDLCDSLNSIWIHCTHHWARHCSDKIDFKHNHQSRATNSSFWNLISEIQWDGDQLRIKQKPRPKKDIIALRKQFLGLGMSIAAFHDVLPEDIDHLIDIGKSVFEEDAIAFYREDELEYKRRLEKKKREIYEAVSTLQSLKPEHPKDNIYPTPYSSIDRKEGSNAHP